MGTVPAPNIVQDASQIAQAPQNALAEYARTANLKQQTADLQQQQQERSLQMQAQQRQLNDQDALTKAMTQFDPAKHTLADVPKLITSNGGSGQAALQAQAGLIQQRRNLAQLSDEQFAEEQKKADLIAGVHDQVSQAAPEQKQQIYQQGLQRLSASGVDVSKEPLQYPGDDVFAQHLPAIRLHSAIVAEAEKDREISAKESEAATKALEAQTTQQKLQAEMPGGPMEAPDKAELRSYLKDPRIPGEMLPPSQRTPASFVAWKAKQTPLARFQIENNSSGTGTGETPAQTAKRFGMTQEAFDQASEKYFTTGQLPPLGRGISGPALNKALMNRAGDLHPGASLAENSAEFAANKKSLETLQKNFDQVTSFENTAGKNLDTFLTTAKNVVDFGSPLVNMPLRRAAALAGGPDQAAYNAARTTALTEIAKVLNSSNASGVLSDSARHEVEGLIGENASLKQIYSAANILKQDMANRHQAYSDQIADIQGRMKTKPQTTTTQQPANQGNDFFSQFGGKARQ